MIVRTGVPASPEFSSAIPVRRFTFRVGEGQPEQLLDGPRLATLVKATSSLSILDVDGIRIVLDGPVGGRPGKQLIVQARQEDSGLKLEVRPRTAANSASNGANSASEVSKAAVRAQAPVEVSSPQVSVSRPENRPGHTSGTIAPNSDSFSRPGSATGAAPTAVAISETIRGSVRTTLFGLLGSEALPLRSGEMLPVQVLLARPDRTVFSVRGVSVEAQVGGFQNGKTYWAEVVTGAPNTVLRIQSSAEDGIQQAAAGSRPSSAPATQPPTAHAPAVLFPADFPAGTNLLARVLSRLPSGDFLLEVGGRQLAAPLPQGIEAGEELLLRVEENQPGAHQIRVLERLRNLIVRPSARLPAADSLGLLSRQLKAALLGGEVPESLRRLAGKVEMMIGEDAPPPPQRIARLIEEGGLQYESKLARILLQNRLQSLGQLLHNDLKALLLRTQNEIRLQPESLQQWSRLAQSVDRHLNHIETLQAANLAAQSQSAPLQLEIPFLSGGHLSMVELFIQPEGGQSAQSEQSGRGFNILFLLDLQGLGLTRVDAFVSGQALRAMISVEQSRALGTLEALLPRLEKSLEQAGFRQAQLAVRALEEHQPEADGRQVPSDPEGAAPAGLNLIDVVA
ncbi:MAG: flagellar hook-length control protein FliK [Acidobacteriota bacterium]